MERVKTTEKIKGIGKKWNKSNIFEAIVVLLLFIVHVWGFWDYDNLIIIKDEFGYWEHAATWMGYDWTGAMKASQLSVFPWYSWGYSVLLLPLFAVFGDMAFMYPAALILNGAMAVGIYFIVKDLARKLWSGIETTNQIAVAAVVALYSSYIAQSKVAWAEILLYLVFWLFLWGFYKMLETENKWYYLLTSCLVGIAYIVHNRMLVLYVAWFLTVLVVTLVRKPDGRKVLLLVVPALLLYWVNGQVKELLQVELATVEQISYGVNDVKSRAWRIGQFFSKEGIGYGIQEVLGQLFYIGAATFLLAFAGVFQTVGSMIRIWKERNVKAKSTRFCFMFLVLISFLGVLALSTLVNMPAVGSLEGTQQSYFYYGRYLDTVTGVLLLLGLLAFLRYSRKVCIGALAGAELLLAVCSWITAGFAAQSANTELNLICVPGVWRVGKLESKDVWEYFLYLSIGMAVIYVLYMLLKKIKYSNFFFLIIAGVVFCWIGLGLADNFIKATHENQGEVITWLNENAQADVIYCTAEDEKIPYYLQSGVNDKRVEVVELSEVENKENIFLVTNQRMSHENFHECTAGEAMVLYVSDGEQYDTLLETGKLQPKNMEWRIDDEILTLEGFHVPEMGGWAWMNGQTASINGEVEPDDYEVTVWLGPTPPLRELKIDSYKVEVSLNGKYMTEMVIENEWDGTEIAFSVNEADWKVGMNTLTFKVEEPWSPAQYGAADTRQLGVAVRSVVFRQKTE